MSKDTEPEFTSENVEEALKAYQTAIERGEIPQKEIDKIWQADFSPEAIARHERHEDFWREVRNSPKWECPNHCRDEIGFAWSYQGGRPDNPGKCKVCGTTAVQVSEWWFSLDGSGVIKTK